MPARSALGAGPDSGLGAELGVGLGAGLGAHAATPQSGDPSGPRGLAPLARPIHPCTDGFYPNKSLASPSFHP
ncbi:MAG: hypothetical protein WBV18_03600, partial [Methyloceanibacter sp.]|uniref:hypothetical protein n=1 Tax=Methyloceanibacter sp. TaxID=1965321 RepID=UPI003C607E68